MGNKLNRSGGAVLDVPVTPGQVWSVITDVTRIGEWSHECHAAQWLEGADRAVVGAQFRGSNQVRSNKWAKTCTITELQPDRRFVYQTRSSLKYPGATEWTFVLEPTAEGCRIVQSFQIISLPKVVGWAMGKMVPEHIDRTQALREDLVRLSQVAAKQPATT